MTREQLHRGEDARRRAAGPGRQAMVTVTTTRQASGDIGPCSHVACRERAAYALLVRVGDVEANTWVCEAHLRELA